MRVLVISKDCASASLCQRLTQEGSDVRLFVFDKNRLTQKALDGMVKKIKNLEKGIRWVGKDGLIVFDEVGYGKMQDDLRKKGYSVVGGSELGDKLEVSRQYGQKILSSSGIKIVSSVSFTNIPDIIKHLKEEQGPWVLKQNGYSNKGLNYVSEFADSRDLIGLLKKYNRTYFTRKDCNHYDLQKRIDGVEIAVARFFNGHDWVGPIDINIEHKNLFNGNIGPKTFEMGNLMWYTKDEKSKLFCETLAKIKPYLQKSNFRGVVDIDCIVNEKGAFPLEITARFGYPAIHAKMEIHSSSWAEFLKAVADGKKYDLEWKKGYAIAVLVAVPPFPFWRPKFNSFSSEGVDIHFTNKLKKSDFRHIHFEEVAQRKNNGYYICDHTGYAIHVSGFGKTVEGARKKAYSLIDNVVIPKKYYRDDIGLKFIQEDRKKLKKWGWI